MTRSVEIPDEALEAAWSAYNKHKTGDRIRGMRAALSAALPYLAPAGAGIQMVDIAAEAREMYGEHADEIAGRKLPEHEWRFELPFSDGARATMHHGATADDVQAYLAMMRNEGRTLQSAPAGDGGLREALEKLADDADHYDTCSSLLNPDAGYECSCLLADIRALLAAHPAAPAVPQPVDREALSAAVYEKASAVVLEGGYITTLIAPEDAVAAVLAVLAGEQEQGG